MSKILRMEELVDDTLCEKEQMERSKIAALPSFLLISPFFLHEC